MSDTDFIFMLTRNDRTIPDAREQLPAVLSAGVRHIGFKDIGLPLSALTDLNREIQQAGAKSYLEVVSLDRDSEIASVRAALTLGVDYLLGGTHVDDVLPLIEASGLRYYPFPGRITGHPSILEGSMMEIVASARDLDEILGMSDRILVMRQGRSAGIHDRRETDAQSLVHLST